MGYAYDWLTKKEKNNISKIQIGYALNRICITLKVLETHRSFEYTKDVEGNTTVVDVQKKEDALTEKYFVDAACEDLDKLMANQNKLELLRVGKFAYHRYDPKPMDPIINKIFELLSKSVASRSSPLQVTNLELSPTKVSEGMSIIRHLDQSELRDVHFRFYGRNTPGKIDDSMIDWNGDSGWKSLTFSLEILTKKSLEGIASSQRFDQILVLFEYRDAENIKSVFGTTLEIDKTVVLIKPHIRRDYPSSEKKNTAQLESMEPSSLSENMALEVLVNSVIMETILEELETFDIQRLRKACRGVRECIDDVKPEPHITAYKIDVNDFRIVVNIRTKHDGRNINYTCDGDALNDFHINLLHQKTCLEELRINLNVVHPLFRNVEIATKIGELLRRRKTALKVETFSMETSAEEEVMQILPYIYKDSLKKISIIHQCYIRRILLSSAAELSTDVIEIARTEQWKRASELSIEEFPVITPIRDMNITHFSTVDILVKTMSSDDVSYLKTELPKSSTLKKFKIKFEVSAIDERLHKHIGEPYRITASFKKIWYFRMPHTDDYLHIVLDLINLLDEKGNLKPKTIIFSKVAKEDTPFF